MIKIPVVMAEDIIGLLEDYRFLAMENEDHVSDILATFDRINTVKDHIGNELADVT